MNQKLLVLALIGLLVSLNSSVVNGEIVDDHKEHVGYSLIKQLYDDAGSAIEELDTQWTSQSALLQRNIHSWTNTVVNQQSLCASRKQDLHDTLKEIDKTQHFIHWISARIRANEGRVERLEELRCRANNLYIDSIKNHRLALSLVDYLIKEINNLENVEMLQKSATMTKLTMFINAYKLGSVSHLLDAPIFTEFKAHLNQQAKSSSTLEDDGESDGEWEDTSDDASSRGALDEIEKDLNSEDEEGGDHAVLGSSNDEEADGECEEEEGSVDENGFVHTGKHCAHHDGEEFDWDTIDEEDDDEESDDDVDSDDEESDDEDSESSSQGAEQGGHAGASNSESGDDETEDEHVESGEHVEGGGHHEATDTEDSDDGEAIEELAAEDAKHSGDTNQVYGLGYNGEQEGTHGGRNQSGSSAQEEIKPWPVYKSEILEVLNELKQHILSTMKQAQDDEVLAGVGLADFKLFIELENRGLERDLANQQARREQLAVQQKKNEWAIDHCLAELQTTKDSEFAAKAEHDTTHLQYNENRAAKESEREIYEYVLGLYEGRINAYNEPHFDDNDFQNLDSTSNDDGETDGEEDGEWVEVDAEGEGEDEWTEGEGEWVEEEVEEDLFL